MRVEGRTRWTLLRSVVLLACIAICDGIGQAAAGGLPGVDSSTVSMLCLGDVNLGRHLGRVMLRGDTLYPWHFLQDTLRDYDIVFANLESNLSDQHGLTEDPHSNTVFTGPPSGAGSLRAAGVTIVSTANNHALDFGESAARQTCMLLDRAGVLHAGSAEDTADVYRPARFAVRGIRFALFACTALMNGARDDSWERWIAAADTGKIYRGIRRVRDSVDVVLVSLHGGVEYSNRPAQEVVSFARGAIDAGADVVLGHHPHVPYGLQVWNNGIIAPSLGNCVFMQPSRYWTQRSFALALRFRKIADASIGISVRCLPLRAGFQPSFFPHGADYDSVMNRVGMSYQREYIKRRS